MRKAKGQIEVGMNIGLFQNETKIGELKQIKKYSDELPNDRIRMKLVSVIDNFLAVEVTRQSEFWDGIDTFLENCASGEAEVELVDENGKTYLLHGQVGIQEVSIMHEDKTAQVLS